MRYLVEGDAFLIERGLTVEAPIDILCLFSLRKFEGDALSEGRMVGKFPHPSIPVQPLTASTNVASERYFLLRPI